MNLKAHCHIEKVCDRNWLCQLTIEQIGFKQSFVFEAENETDAKHKVVQFMKDLENALNNVNI